MAPGDPSPIDPAGFKPGMVVGDVIILAHDTPLLAAARLRGCAVMGGRPMTEGQAEEMARFLFIWMVMLGAMVGVRDASHFEVDVWPELKPKANALLRIVSNVFVLAFALIFIWYGIKFVQFGWDQSSELAEMPMTWIFVAWPLAGFTWVLFLGEWFIKDLRLIFADRVSPLANIGKPRL